MKNEVFYPNDPADKLSLPVANNTASGAPVKVGSLVGVTATAEGEGGNPEGHASVWTAGVYRLQVGTGAVASVGLPIYITSGGALTATATDNTLFGYALETKASGASVIRVKLAKV